MKIAIFSDIHGNDYALNEVLKSAVKEGIQKLLILGDFVGYYYNAHKVFEMLNDWDYSFIKGNHEGILDQVLQKNENLTEIKRKYGSGHYMAIERLSKEYLNRLISAQDLKIEKIDGLTFKMCHGAPWDVNEYIYPDSRIDILEKCDDVNADFVLIGHSHYSFIHCNKGSILINPGSIGQSKNMGGFAYWTVINTENKIIEFKVTPYDSTKLEREIETYDPDVPFLKTVLKRNH
ncbi:MAG: metallophosphoesterase family protein [Bacteroidia bacterium]